MGVGDQQPGRETGRAYLLSTDSARSETRRAWAPSYDRSDIGAGVVNFAAALHQLQDPKIDYGQLLRQRHFHDDYTYTIPGTSAIRGTVSQDSFHSLEVVSGTANLHLALSWGPYATTADLDLYLYDPAGNLKAKSDGMNLDGLFGAAESIDLREPDAGRWTAVVRAKLPALSATDYSFSREASVGSYSRLSAFAADDQKAMQRLVRSSAMGPGKTVNGQEKIDRANLARAFVAYGQPKFQPAAQSFSDVSGSSTLFLESCAGARSLGRALFGSYAEGPILTKLEPKTTVTRLEYAKAVVRFAGLEEEAHQRNGAILPFDDASLLSTQDRGYMAVALDRRLLDPVGTRLDPSGSLTSLMLARGLYRLD